MKKYSDPIMTSTVLVTGASTGIGNLTARARFRHILRVEKLVELVRAMLRPRGVRVPLVSRRLPASSASGAQILDWVL